MEETPPPLSLNQHSEIFLDKEGSTYLSSDKPGYIEEVGEHKQLGVEVSRCKSNICTNKKTCLLPLTEINCLYILQITFLQIKIRERTYVSILMFLFRYKQL